MTDYGTVEGTLHKTKQGYWMVDVLLPRRVWVYSNIDLHKYVGKRISLEGDLEYDKNGNVILLDHYHELKHPNLPFVFKNDSELPTADDVRGILPDKKQEVKELREGIEMLSLKAVTVVLLHKDEEFFDEMDALFQRGFAYLSDAMCFLEDDE